jgi:KDO2-lipid IV(A) lauroyltransferase
MRSYARYWKEAFRLPSIPAERVISTMCLDGADLLDRLYAEGRGVVVALAHSGNWDHAGAWAALTGKPVVTVAERLKPESLYHRFLDYRASIGIEAIPLTGGTKPPLDALEDRLRAGGLVCLLADRDLSRRGIEVSFFGGRARMPAGPALLALRSGAPLLVCQLWYDGPVSRGRLIGPLPIPAEGSLTERTAALTQAIAVIFEEGIRAHPQDWHMLQRLWIDEDLAGEGPAGEGPAGEGSGVAR